jgi:hypothetical protein
MVLRYFLPGYLRESARRRHRYPITDEASSIAEAVMTHDGSVLILSEDLDYHGLVHRLRDELKDLSTKCGICSAILHVLFDATSAAVH